MPRKNPVPKYEKEICQRLMQARLETKLSRVAFAKEIGVDSGFLANIEYGCAPVRFGLAKRVGERFNINQGWLAEGRFEVKPYVEINLAIDESVLERALFSDVYARLLKSHVERRTAIIMAGAKGGIKVTFPDAVEQPPIEDYLSAITRTMFNALCMMPPHLHSKLAADTADFISRFHDKHKKEIAHFRAVQLKKSPPK